ncbi:MAG TPA: hypothetical protein VK928_09320 [Longimicrobiales bacterium]|nr:hypothetical protein [Longimicrobiales bacterium]
MSRFPILVISAAPAMAAWLSEHLPADEYEVSDARPDASLIQAVRQARPRMAILDGIDGRPASAQLEVALLKDQCPGVLIVARSETSSLCDGDVIEQGIFCYLAGSSAVELLRVIEAATTDRRRADGNAVMHNQPRSVT